MIDTTWVETGGKNRAVVRCVLLKYKATADITYTETPVGYWRSFWVIKGDSKAIASIRVDIQKLRDMQVAEKAKDDTDSERTGKIIKWVAIGFVALVLVGVVATIVHTILNPIPRF